LHYQHDTVAHTFNPDARKSLRVPDSLPDSSDVRRRLEDFMPNDGFVFNSVHNIQGNVPPENIMAMWETVREFGYYSV